MSDDLGTEHARRPVLVITGAGVRVESTPGSAARGRGGAAAGGNALAHAIERTDGVRTIDSATITRLDIVSRGTRGAHADGSIVVNVDRSADDERQVVLVQEGDRYTWAIPGPEADRVVLPVEALPGSRGFLPKSVHRVVHLIGVKTLGWAAKKATTTFVGAWDQKHHSPSLRSWTPQNHRLTGAVEPDWGALGRGPALLVIHGFTGSIDGSFGDLPVDVVGRIHDAYNGRTFAFDHPTLTVSPLANAEWLRKRLLDADVPLELDVLAHSRGGLVARELAQRLAGGGIGVRSITFVATPNAGTPLADPARPEGLLDALTNLAGAVPGGDIVEMVLELLKDLVVDSVLGGLQGLMAMAPGGEYLNGLNALAVRGDLCVRSISADFEPRSSAGIVESARNRAVDLYFGGLRNDTIVPTLSTIVTAGAFSVPAAQRLVLDSSRGVDHSSFWTNPRATQQLLAWLRPDWRENAPAPIPAEESEPGAETALPPDPLSIAKVVDAIRALPEKARKGVESVLGGPVNLNATKPTGERPAVVVVPGIMGTHLAGATGELVWLDALRLRRGHFSDLRLPAGDGGPLQPAGVNTTYLPLISHLAESWDVYLAPFDWRDDIRTSARRLATVLQKEVFPGRPDRPVHIVAHSMGGLVARAMAFAAEDAWNEMGNERRASDAGGTGRLVMLGTPNHGSFATVLLLSGAEMIVKALAAVDVRNDAEELIDVVASFPGVYQMLPSRTAPPGDDQHGELFDAASWKRASPLAGELLAGADAFHREMAEVRDPERLVYVAGYGHPTPFRVEIANGALSLGVIRRGDGRVALALGQLDGVDTYYSEATHGGLPSDPDVLAALPELLAHGRTEKLKDAEPVRRGGDALERPAMIPIDVFDPGMASRGEIAAVDPRATHDRLEDAVRLTIGGGSSRRERVRLEISVLHASLEQASHPVAVGHYAGLPPGGAERFLDRKLDGALRARQRVGQYPDRAASAIYVPVPPGRRPRGGLVLGLGEFGTLTKGTLTESMAQAVVARVLDDRQRAVPSDDPAVCGVSSVLIGIPGRHGLSVESSIVALTEGVLAAIGRLATLEPPIKLASAELELVELYEQPAEEAAVVVCRIVDLLEPSLAGLVDVVPLGRLRSGEGGQPSAPPRDASGTPWVRVMVGLKEPDDGDPPSDIRTMRFSTLARGAQSNLMEYGIDLAKVHDYIASAVRRVDDDAVSRTLYELLFPVRAKLDLDRSESLHLLVDEPMAEIPWELLAATSLSGDVTPLALRAGMLRQLQSDQHTRERSEAPSGRWALVVGDPPTGGVFPPLPGARMEAEQVKTLLASADWDVEPVLFDDETGDDDEWTRVLDAINRHPYRVVHIAAHGVFEADDRSRSGVIIGPKPHHRLTALEFEKMTVTPELVFLNCCHLGHFDDLSSALTSDERRAVEQPHKMAATVAQQLLRNGVRAVVVAGWAVDDAAALAFAETLYARMLEGHPFGEAVRRARVAAHQADSGMTNTWGAYQCYGDPDFLLVAEEWVPTKETPIVSPGQLARELQQAAIRAGNSTTQAYCTEVRQRVDDLRVAGKELLDDAAVLEALGHAYGELGRYEDAVAALLESMRQDTAGVRLQAIEQLANFEVRSATRLLRAADLPSPEAAALFDRAADRLHRLEGLAGKTAERHALRGSLEKKRATMLRDGARAAALIRSRDAFHEAWRLSSSGEERLDSYHTNLWLQLVALTAKSGTIGAREAKVLDRLYQELIDPAAEEAGYFELAAIADTTVTAVVVGRPLNGKAVALAEAKAQYETAFELRSTVRQRESARDHLADLSLLVDADRGKELRRLHDELDDA